MIVGFRGLVYEAVGGDTLEKTEKGEPVLKEKA